jgi:hypothetical protein
MHSERGARLKMHFLKRLSDTKQRSWVGSRPADLQGEFEKESLTVTAHAELERRALNTANRRCFPGP